MRRTATPTRSTSFLEDFPEFFDIPSPVADNPEGGEQRDTGPEVKREAEPAPPRPLSRGHLIDRGGFLERKRLRNEIDSGPDAHRGMAAKGHQKPEAEIQIIPGPHESQDQIELKDGMDWNPESFTRYSTAVRLDQIGPLGPERINDKKLVQAPAQRKQGERRCGGDG